MPLDADSREQVKKFQDLSVDAAGRRLTILGPFRCVRSRGLGTLESSDHILSCYEASIQDLARFRAAWEFQENQSHAREVT